MKYNIQYTIMTAGTVQYDSEPRTDYILDT